ncbi:unnamed protein product [Heligmosomoides polygyrus]|uniref:AAA_12 domain-containing protein n=1 Tax=Heligmosomoides polygyrus TaxID=6339 RepID=A0A183F3C7_HELPZ|nr:unnamed protein product [Heligmosomoides polygyrus]
MLLNMMRFPSQSLPFMFLNVTGSSRIATHSHFNDAEAMVCTTLVGRLLARGIAASSICIITFYKENVVVLLTTKTDFQADAAEFLDDPHRMNVALTRCKHGQFVLGHQASVLF